MKKWIASTYAAIFWIGANPIHANELPPSFYTLAPITHTEPGNFGNMRLYFQVACNQEFLGVLTEAQDAQSFNAGILTRVYTSGCNRPARTKYASVKTYGATINPVSYFDEVWHCQSSCTIFVNGRPQSYRLEAFGTSIDETRSQISCSGVLTDLACQEVEVRDP